VRIGILVAMQEEFQPLVARLADVRKGEAARRPVVHGRLGAQEVTLIAAGVGKVNAAMAAQILIDRYAVSALYLTGVAGGVAPGLRPGDVVVADEVLQHDVDSTPLGFAPGEIPFADRWSFPTDERLRARLLGAVEAVTGKPPLVGRIVSGDRFVADREEVLRLRERFRAAAVEMEGGALGQVAWANGIPFAVLRTVSDTADGEAPRDFTAFLAESAERAARILVRAIAG